MFLALACEDVPLLSKHVGEIDRLEVELEPPFLDALRVEKVVHERREPPSLRVDDLEVVPAVDFVDVSFQQKVREAEDARQRRAELVGDDADQLRFQTLAFAQQLVLVLELSTARSETLGHLVEGARELRNFPGSRFFETHAEVSAGDAVRSFRRAA